MIEDFNISADGSTKLLQEMLILISDGKVPDKEDVDKLELSIQTLQGKYSLITSFVASQIPKEELPTPGSSVNEFIHAFEEADNESEFVHSLKKNNILIRDGDDLGSYSMVYSPLEDKKVSSKKFLRDVRKGNVKAAKDVLVQVVKTNSVSKEYFLLMGMSQSKANSTFKKLKKHGYLREYSRAPGGSIYCVSHRLMKALEYKKVKKFLGIRIKTDILEKANGTTTTSVATRIAYANICRTCLEDFVYNQDIYNCSEAGIMNREFFCFRIIESEDIENYVVAVGAFWSNTDNCDEDLSALKEFLYDTESIKILIIAGLDKYKAKSLYKMLVSLLDYDFSQTTVYLYSLSDTSCYTLDLIQMVKLGVYDIKRDRSDIDKDYDQSTETDAKLDDEIDEDLYADIYDYFNTKK